VVGGIFFYFAVANPSFTFRRDATVLTVVVWIVLALAAGLVAERLRRRLVETFTQIADREAQVRLTLESTAAAVGLFAGPDLRCRNANAPLRALFARPDWQQQPLVTLLPNLDPEVLAALRACALDRQQLQRDEIMLPGTKRFFSLTARCSSDQEDTLLLTLSDVTAAVGARHGLDRLLELSRELYVSVTSEAVAAATCRVAIEMFGCRVVSLWRVEDAHISLVDRAPTPTTEVEWAIADVPGLAAAVHTGQPQFIQDLAERLADDTVQSARLREYVERQGFHSVLWIPIVYAGDIGALLFLAWDELAEQPDEPMITIAQRFADETAIAIERAQRQAAQQQAATLHNRLEQSLLPRVAVTDERLHVAFRYRPGEARMLIGGDFMDTAELGDGTLALVIGDVSGHGPDAAALGATLRASWSALALTGMAPLDLVQRLDGILRRDVADSTVFATLCCAWVNPARDRLTLVLAGHHRPLVLADGTAREPEAPFGPPLGLLEDWMRVADPPWQAAGFDLEPGWALLLYTDGLVEGHAAPDARERFGVARLAPLLHHKGAVTCLDARALDDVLDQVQAANGKPFGDDVALLVVCHADADGGAS
jgi:serine phosphatase RsbU (regulator of sigma subunit)